MNVKDLRAGNLVDFDGNIYVCTSLSQAKQARQAAVISATFKNIKTGGMIEKSLRITETVAEANKEEKEMQFLYADGDIFYFMDPESFEQVPVNRKDAAGALKYNKEGAVYTFTSVNGKLISVEPATFVVQEVVETDSAVAGDTARNALKEAKLECGVTIKVPMFVKTGDLVEVDTRTDAYVGRK